MFVKWSAANYCFMVYNSRFKVQRRSGHVGSYKQEKIMRIALLSGSNMAAMTSRVTMLEVQTRENNENCLVIRIQHGCHDVTCKQANNILDKLLLMYFPSPVQSTHLWRVLAFLHSKTDEQKSNKSANKLEQTSRCHQNLTRQGFQSTQLFVWHM